MIEFRRIFIRVVAAAGACAMSSSCDVNHFDSYVVVDDPFLKYGVLVAHGSNIGWISPGLLFEVSNRYPSSSDVWGPHSASEPARALRIDCMNVWIKVAGRTIRPSQQDSQFRNACLAGPEIIPVGKYIRLYFADVIPLAELKRKSHNTFHESALLMPENIEFSVPLFALPESSVEGNPQQPGDVGFALNPQAVVHLKKKMRSEINRHMHF